MSTSERGWIKGLKTMFTKDSDGYIPQKVRERMLADLRAKGIAEDDMPPEWWMELTYELSLLGGVDGKRVWDLVNTKDPYPSAIPVLLEWLENFDERTAGPVTRWNDGTREGINRALTVDEAKGTKAADLMVAQFHHDPPLHEFVLEAAANALGYLAGPEYFDRIAEIVKQCPPRRAALIEWLGKSRRAEALPLLVDQLDDPEVATWTMATIRRKKLSPDALAEIRPKIEHYLDYPGDKRGLPGELRKQANLTMKKLYPQA